MRGVEASRQYRTIVDIAAVGLTATDMGMGGDKTDECVLAGVRERNDDIDDSAWRLERRRTPESTICHLRGGKWLS